MNIIDENFYLQSSEKVAKNLLGKNLIKKEENCVLKGKIVEVEAYYGEDDPASRAFQNRVTKVSRWMWKKGGIAFIYMVHGHWLFNIVTGKTDQPEGILIRALEPLKNIDRMKERRQTSNLENLTSGPGKLTQAFSLNDKYNGSKVYHPCSKIIVGESDNKEEFKIEDSYRVGVSKDLSRKLRFFIKDNCFVSKKNMRRKK
ncbi:MAG: DNA-3-methyladenine glycosylase [Candidatus Thermoplasmatota archaeon]